MQDKITVVLDYLNEVKTRCIYDAAAKALKITPQALKKLLGQRRPETSWLVNAGTVIFKLVVAFIYPVSVNAVCSFSGFK